MTSSPRIQPAIHVSIALMENGRLLLVREDKPSLAGLWNLPGGHIERGESILHAAARELVEETHLTAPIESLIAIYSGPTSIRFVFRAHNQGQIPTAGDEIRDVRFFDFNELRQLDDKDLVAPILNRPAFADIEAGKNLPLDPFVTLISGQGR